MERLAPRGLKLVMEFPPGETVVGLLEYKGAIFVATNRRAFRYSAINDVLVPVAFCEHKSE